MEKSELIYCRLIECVHKNDVKESEQIKIITDLAKYLGLKTLTNYADQEKISYPAAKKRLMTNKLKVVRIDDIDFIINNE